MESLYADLSRMGKAASGIRSSAAEYRKIYQRLLQAVRQSSGWQGADREAFRKQVEGFEDNLNQMAKLMEAYADMVDTAENYYRRAQKTAVSEAKRLW